jgi:integrase
VRSRVTRTGCRVLKTVLGYFVCGSEFAARADPRAAAALTFRRRSGCGSRLRESAGVTASVLGGPSRKGTPTRQGPIWSSRGDPEKKCDEHLRPIVITALRTGMRRGKILNLQWTEVGFTKRPDHNRGAVRMIDKALGPVECHRNGTNSGTGTILRFRRRA